MGSICVGIDIGQKIDPTAIAVVEIEAREDAPTHRYEDYHLVRHLERLPLGTPYPGVARRVAEVLTLMQERQQVTPAAVWLDSTGVGLPVVDLLQAAGVPVTPVYFTHGDRLTRNDTGTITLGKALLVAQMQVLLQSGRILLPKTVEAEALAKELLDYEIKVDEKANDTYGAFKTGTHDDLVTCLGLAVLAAHHGPKLPFAWIRDDPVFRAQFAGQKQASAAPETDQERIARRLAARELAVSATEEPERPHKYGAPLPTPCLPNRWE